MWVMLNDCFFSIVSKDCARDEVLVRARRPGDIEKLWPPLHTGIKVRKTANTDYAYRALIKRVLVERALAGEVGRITYDNFKDSVRDAKLHDAYLRVWTAMASVQPTRPYGSSLPVLDFIDENVRTAYEQSGKKKPRRKRRSIKRGR